MILTSESYSILREKLFKPLKQSQVDGLEFLVEAMTTAKFTYPEAAYALATVYVETDKTMQPITERGSIKYFDKYDTGKLAKTLGNTLVKDGDGYRLRGRGYVQITGTDNYYRIGKLIGVDLFNHPDKALEPEIAARILTQGMLNGWFTGVGFRKKRPVDRYDRAKYIKARNIINGNDRAAEIADYALIFEKALRS